MEKTIVEYMKISHSVLANININGVVSQTHGVQTQLTNYYKVKNKIIIIKSPPQNHN